MAEITNTTRNTAKAFKSDKGGWPNKPGPYIGTIMDNHDPTHSGRVFVKIPEISVTGDALIPVSYMSPFLGNTLHAGTSDDTGTYVGNPQSYGMWFPIPDVGVQVLCFFVNGDQDRGYYIGGIPNADMLHMVPGVGASENWEGNNSAEEERYASAPRVPVTELNNKNQELTEDPRYFDRERPVHSIVASSMFQQGVITDKVRGPISSNAYRESPSAAFGVSTPGRPIYESGVTDYNVKQSLDAGSPRDFKVIGRHGGHSIVLDDGDLTGRNNLVRIRTAKGHQITMSDDGNTIHIMHANGQSWVELGNEGTLDVYAANSVNIRTQGTLNFHADEDINMYAGKKVNIHSKEQTNIESEKVLNLIGEKDLTAYSKKKVVVRSDGTLSIHADQKVSMHSKLDDVIINSSKIIPNKKILLNTTGPLAAPKPKFTVRTKLPEQKFDAMTGWKSEPAKLDSICSRAPHHEPWPEHNKGVPTTVNLGG